MTQAVEGAPASSARAGGPVRCVVLDIDDTLYRERCYIGSGFVAVENALGIRGLAAASWSAFLAGHRGDIFNRALHVLDERADPGLIETMVILYREHAPAISLLPDVNRWLRESAHRYRLAYISDGPVNSQCAKVAALGLPARIGHIVLTDGYGPGFGKPHPRAFTEVAAASGYPAIEHVYVADNPLKDFIAPYALGWHTVRIRRPHSLHEACDTPDYVDAEISDFDLLDAVLLRWGAAGTTGQR
jgi:putative hydrolase of the HAD superfamily